MADATSIFTGRRPAFDAEGKVRGFRSRPGAPQADPTNRAGGSSNALSASAWRDTFKTISPQSELAALSSDLMMPEGTAGGGIAGKTLDATFGPGFFARLMDRGPMVQYSPRADLYTPKPFMPGQQGDKFTVPKPLTSPFGDKASDRANMGANRSLYAPGGAAGLWGRRVGSAPRAFAPTIADAATIEGRYRA